MCFNDLFTCDPRTIMSRMGTTFGVFGAVQQMFRHIPEVIIIEWSNLIYSYFEQCFDAIGSLRDNVNKGGEKNVLMCSLFAMLIQLVCRIYVTSTFINPRFICAFFQFLASCFHNLPYKLVDRIEVYTECEHKTKR